MIRISHTNILPANLTKKQKRNASLENGGGGRAEDIHISAISINIVLQLYLKLKLYIQGA